MTLPLYLFGLVRTAEAPAALAAVRAVAGPRDLGPVRGLEAGPIVGLVADCATAEVAPARRNLLGHARVLEAAMGAGALLPVRFGHVAPDADELERLVRSNAPAILDGLDRLTGRAEFGIRVSGGRDGALAAIVAETPAIEAEAREVRALGTAGHYRRIAIGRRLAEALSARRADAEAALAEAVSAVAERVRMRRPETDNELLRCEALVRAEAEPALLEALRTAAGRTAFAPGRVPDIRVIGPAPAYNFVSLRLAPAGRPSVEAR